jgi:hypothetical protein
VVVGSVQCRHVYYAQLADRCEALASPREWFTAEALQQQVCHQPRMTAISVWKGVDKHESMVESYRKRVGLVRLVREPVTRSIEQR